jgi:DnaJ-class molecular chaperone
MMERKIKTCDMCEGSGQIKEIVVYRGAWVFKPRRCDKCKGFGRVVS